jgi:hypothetical protein
LRDEEGAVLRDVETSLAPGAENPPRRAVNAGRVDDAIRADLRRGE